MESGQLPPCKECLHMHTLRDNPSGIWHRSVAIALIFPSSLIFMAVSSVTMANSPITGSLDPKIQRLFWSCFRANAGVCQAADGGCPMNGLRCTKLVVSKTVLV